MGIFVNVSDARRNGISLPAQPTLRAFPPHFLEAKVFKNHAPNRELRLSSLPFANDFLSRFIFVEESAVCACFYRVVEA